jgi:hypothetical protein
MNTQKSTSDTPQLATGSFILKNIKDWFILPGFIIPFGDWGVSPLSVVPLKIGNNNCKPG